MSSEINRKKLLAQVAKDTQTFSTQVFLFKQQVAEQLNIYPTDFQCINILDQAGPLSAGELAKRLGLTTGAMTTAIHRLEASGYVQRSPDPSDGRKIVVALAGRNVKNMRAVFKPIETQMESVYAQLTDAELAVVAKYLSLMTRVEN